MDDFTYNRSWEQIEDLLQKVVSERAIHKRAINDPKTSMKAKAQHMRDYKGLQGASYALRWVLGDRRMTRGKVLGVER